MPSNCVHETYRHPAPEYSFAAQSGIMVELLCCLLPRTCACGYVLFRHALTFLCWHAPFFGYHSHPAPSGINWFKGQASLGFLKDNAEQGLV